jgi:signal transduction histidine kinase
MSSFHAPAERKNPDELLEVHHKVASNLLGKTLFDTLPGIVALLTDTRQVVLASAGLLSLLQKQQVHDILGLRPGELFACVHSKENVGCGTTKACQYCGAVNAILDSMSHNTPVHREARILVQNDQGIKALDLEVDARSISCDDSIFTLLTLHDISAVKHREVLERLFYHDIRNTVGGLRGLSELIINSPNAAEQQQFARFIHEIADQLLDEINSQQMIVQAEAGELQLNYVVVDLAQLAHSVRETLLHHQVAKERHIRVLMEHPTPLFCQTDAVLARRVLINMVKNALEASPEQYEVVIQVQQNTQGQAGFLVHNPGEIPIATRLQLFQRNFSTKGTGRGLGTYSMKLLGEKYLKGQVDLSFSGPEGTCFSFWLPL